MSAESLTTTQIFAFLFFSKFFKNSDTDNEELLCFFLNQLNCKNILWDFKPQWSSTDVTPAPLQGLYFSLSIAVTWLLWIKALIRVIRRNCYILHAALWAQTDWVLFIISKHKALRIYFVALRKRARLSDMVC